MTDISTNSTTNSLINGVEDMVYNTEDKSTTAGGYSVDSILLNQGMPALYDGVNYDTVGGGKHHKVSDRFKHLAVPAGLLYINESMYKISDSNTVRNSNTVSDSNTVSNRNDVGVSDIDNNATIINDDLYEKLLTLAQPEIRGRETTKTTATHKKTKKHKHKVNKKKTKRRY